MVYHKVELGFRIQDKTNDSFFVKENTAVCDPKYKLYDSSNEIEYRTFCACKDGEVIVANSNGIHKLF